MKCPSGSGNLGRGGALIPLSQPQQSLFHWSNTLKSQWINKLLQAFRQVYLNHILVVFRGKVQARKRSASARLLTWSYRSRSTLALMEFDVIIWRRVKLFYAEGSSVN